MHGLLTFEHDVLDHLPTCERRLEVQRRPPAAALVEAVAHLTTLADRTGCTTFGLVYPGLHGDAGCAWHGAICVGCPGLLAAT